MATNRKYYSVIHQEHTNASWTIQFGDYDKKVATGEMKDMSAYDDFRGILRVIETGDQQADIQAEVNRLNKEIEEYMQASLDIGMTGG